MKALALIFEGFEEEEAMAPFALIRRAGGDLTICSNSKTVTGSHSLTMANIELLANVDYKQFDCLIIPGGAHYKYLMENEKVHEIISYFFDTDKLVCGICAAPTVFGALGYLKGRNYTCFTAMNKEFGGIYHKKGVVVDGNLITARSVAYSLDFAYAIVEKMLGKDTLDWVQDKIYYEK